MRSVEEGKKRQQRLLDPTPLQPASALQTGFSHTFFLQKTMLYVLNVILKELLFCFCPSVISIRDWFSVSAASLRVTV